MSPWWEAGIPPGWPLRLCSDSYGISSHILKSPTEGQASGLCWRSQISLFAKSTQSHFRGRRRKSNAEDGPRRLPWRRQYHPGQHPEYFTTGTGPLRRSTLGSVLSDQHGHPCATSWISAYYPHFPEDETSNSCKETQRRGRAGVSTPRHPNLLRKCYQPALKSRQCLKFLQRFPLKYD